MSHGTTAAGGMPAFTITSDGAPIPDTYEVTALEVCEEVDSVSTARITLLDGDPAERDFAISESKTFAPGAAVEIALGYDSKVQTVFSGIVTGQRIEAAPDAPSQLQVEIRHACFRMANARTSRVWIKRTDADALSELAAAHGVAFKGKSNVAHPQMVQHQASDWDFALLRARSAGQILVPGLDGLRMMTPDLSQSPGATLEYGDNILSFDLDLDVGLQAESVETAAWTPSKQTLLTARAKADIVPGPGNLSGAQLAKTSQLTPLPRHPGMRDTAELDAWARADMTRRRLAAISGAVTAQGISAVTTGGTVELKGLGARFDGVAFVSGVRHMLSEGVWRTVFRIGLDPDGANEREDVSAPPAAGLAPGISGLQIGVVDKIDGDPMKEGRVAVRIVTHDHAKDAIWARPLSIGGGPKQGLVMLPDVGSECLLGFLDGDPRDPVLIGGLHSSRAPSPLPESNANTVKGVVSRTGMKITFDDAAVSLSLETPRGNRVTLSDKERALALEDANGNSVKLDPTGVTLRSRKNLTLKASGKLVIDGAAVDIKGMQSARLESGGATVVKGAVSATLESDGVTIIKGAKVVTD